VAQARLAAAASAPGDDFEESLKNLATVKALDKGRRDDAITAIRHACRRLNDGKNPTSDLHPPATCVVCAGRSGGTHYFLCKSRIRQPGPQEVRARDAIFSKLNARWRSEQSTAIDEVKHSAPWRATRSNATSLAYLARFARATRAHTSSLLCFFQPLTVSLFNPTFFLGFACFLFRKPTTR
jgi:hypothetical protein